MLSRLESLPAELLQPILLYSNNISLPLCSHVIGAKLSNEEAFREISVYYLFEPDASQAKSRSKHYSNVRSLIHTPQYRILSARFMTLAKFKLYLGVALDRFIWPSSISPSALITTFFDLSLHDTNPIFGREATLGYLHEFGLKLGYVYLLSPLYELCERATIPPRFLNANVVGDQAEFLHFLLRCGLRIAPDHLTTFKRERLEIFRTAAVHGNHVLLACLFSQQLGLRIVPRLLRHALLDLEIPVASLETILLADYVRTNDAWYTSKAPRDMRKIDKWVAEERAKGNLRALHIDYKLLNHRRLRAKVAGKSPTNGVRSVIDPSTPVVPTSFEELSTANKPYEKASVAVKVRDWFARKCLG